MGDRLSAEMFASDPDSDGAARAAARANGPRRRRGSGPAGPPRAGRGGRACSAARARSCRSRSGGRAGGNPSGGPPGKGTLRPHRIARRRALIGGPPIAGAAGYASRKRSRSAAFEAAPRGQLSEPVCRWGARRRSAAFDRPPPPARFAGHREARGLGELATRARGGLHPRGSSRRIDEASEDEQGAPRICLRDNLLLGVRGRFATLLRWRPEHRFATLPGIVHNRLQTSGQAHVSSKLAAS